MRRGGAAQAADVEQAIAGLQGLRVAVVVIAAAPPPPQCLPAAALSPAALAAPAASCDLACVHRPPLLCRCERQLQLQLSRTSANPNRLFYSCSNRSCRSNTFVWAEPSRAGNAHAVAQHACASASA